MIGRTATAVIGAGYGDEGKGLLVDALAAADGEPATVVRSNGGAQAGHTVTLADGRRHVFHHLGSGALAGAATHLSRFFVHHPMLFQDERRAVAALGGSVAVSADPRGPVTTPWDMLINQAVERARGAARHGSCGLGFGETLERTSRPAYALTLGDLASADLAGRLRAIRDIWLPRRLADLGVDDLDPAERSLATDDAVLEVFLQDCADFLDSVRLAPDAMLGAAKRVVFEGAQGLELDQAIGAFPYVTRSHTGLVNIAAIAREAGLRAIDAIYVTRAYASRHGAGPLPGGGATLDGFEILDPTNAPNPWQGRMRYAPLDVDRLGKAIAADQALCEPGPISVERRIAVTCLDQARGPITVRAGSATHRSSPADIPEFVARSLGLKLAAQSWGPSRGSLHRMRVGKSGVRIT